MRVYKGIRPVREEIGRLKKKGRSIGLVPTMGYLHDGHLSLIRKARKDCDSVVVSIFVNPTQFGPEEDFKRYPRSLRRDLALCRKQSVDIVFAPDVKSIYPKQFSTYVNVEKLTDTLCGTSRPGHFKGVTTIVAKLFNIVQPDTAYFGQKDAQQAIVVKRMVEDLNMPVKIKVMPVIREKDGLAMSSRNKYLNNGERIEALSLHRSLRLARKLYIKGEKNPDVIKRKIRNLIAKHKNTTIDYVSIVDLNELNPVKKLSRGSLVALAVNIGKTRLIDNIILN